MRPPALPAAALVAGARAWWRAGPAGRTTRRARVDAAGCVGCGCRTFEQRAVIRDHLAESWGLRPHERNWFDRREGQTCAGCGMSLRVRMLVWTLRRVAPSLDGLRVLHCNQVNHLSPLLRAAGELVETSYEPSLPWGHQAGGLINQDLERLGFADATFDLVIHSETLEHVFDYRRALAEAHRVLKPGGRQLYSVPLLHQRRTRARLERGSVGNLVERLPPSFHGVDREFPVVWELGGDFLAERRGWLERVDYDQCWRNPTVFAIAERKPTLSPAAAGPSVAGRG